MITEKRTLPIGIDYNGEIHRELELRPRLVKDMVAATGSALVVKDKNNFEICCLAAQITKLGNIPVEEITGELIAEMYETDFDVLSEAAEVARKRVGNFRHEQTNDKTVDSGAGKDGIQA